MSLRPHAAPLLRAAALLLFALPALARASSQYPAALQEELALAPPRPLPCTLCHETASGGSSTVVRPFGLALLDRGATGRNRVSNLLRTVREVRDAGLDSDGDGAPDVEELTQLRNPNLAGTDALFPAGGAGEDPSYGCSTGAAGSATAAGLLALAALLRRREARPTGARRR